MPSDLDLLNQAARLLQARTPITLCTVVEKRGSGPRDVGAKMLVTGDGKNYGTIGGGNVEQALIKECRKAIEDGKSKTITFSLNKRSKDGGVETGMICGGELTVLADVIMPAQRMIIVGAGHIAVPLARLASVLGFDVVVVDDEQKKANKDLFPTVQTMLAGEYSQVLNDFPMDQRDAVVIAHGDPEHDYAALKSAIGKKPAYLGLLGSKTKAKLVSDRLRSDGISEEEIKMLHVPIGLEIGAQTPEEIGISILAEIISLNRKTQKQ